MHVVCCLHVPGLGAGASRENFLGDALNKDTPYKTSIQMGEANSLVGREGCQRIVQSSIPYSVHYQVVGWR